MSILGSARFATILGSVGFVIMFLALVLALRHPRDFGEGSHLFWLNVIAFIDGCAFMAVEALFPSKALQLSGTIHWVFQAALALFVVLRIIVVWLNHRRKASRQASVTSTSGLLR